MTIKKIKGLFQNLENWIVKHFSVCNDVKDSELVQE